MLSPEFAAPRPPSTSGFLCHLVGFTLLRLIYIPLQVMLYPIAEVMLVFQL